MRRTRGYVVTAAVLLILGCGGDGLRRVSVQGKVTAKGDVVDQSTVLFMPLDTTKGEGAIGTTDKDGNFTLTGSRQGARGIVPGKYKVRVSRFVERDGKVLDSEAKQADHPHAQESVPAPYSSPDSPLEITIPDKGGAVAVEIPAKLIVRKK